MNTANEWKERENGIWEISNRTYKMRYKISYVEATDIYLVSWGIIYNTPKQPNSKYANYWGDSIIIPFINEFPRDSELYRLMSTTPGDK